MAENKKNDYMLGVYPGFALGQTEEQYGVSEGGPRFEPGTYRMEVVGQRAGHTAKSENLIYVDMEYQLGPDEPEALQKYIEAQISFKPYDLNNPKTVPWYNGLLHQLSWWQFWPQLQAPALKATGMPHPLVDWYVRTPLGAGPIIEVRLEHETRPKTNAKGETEQKTYVIAVQGSVQLLEPSAFAKRVFEQIGLGDWNVKDPPAGLADFSKLFGDGSGGVPPIYKLASNGTKGKMGSSAMGTKGKVSVERRIPAAE